MGVCASLFFNENSELETLNNRVKPSDDQIAYLRKQKEDVEEWLKGELCDLGYDVSTFLQGSYRFHTLIKPLVPKGEYDVDLGFYFIGGNSAGANSAALRDAVQRSLIRYEDECDQAIKVEDQKERCSRIKYKKKFHIDVPVYHETEGGRIVRLATLTTGWERSDPSAMLEWFREALDPDSATRAMTRRLVRYMKAWAALTFMGSDEVPSSLMLTVLTVDAIDVVVAAEDADDDALAKIVRHMHGRMQRDSCIPNPVQGDGDTDLNRLSANAHQRFVDALEKLAGVAERGATAEDEVTGALAWSEVFSYVFPLPDALDVVTSDTGGGVVAASPTITAEIYEGGRSTLVGRYDGYVPYARVGQEIKFIINNPGVIPAGARVKWVVRNAGTEAHSISDLGHSFSDDGSRTQWESAAYMGHHYMDCEVWLHDSLRSLCRVPVGVTKFALPARHPPRRPGYTRILGRRR